jgi:hypothetical protein
VSLAERMPSSLVRDQNGQALAHVYFEDEKGRRPAMGCLTRDEARRITINVAKLPEQLLKSKSGPDAG